MQQQQQQQQQQQPQRPLLNNGQGIGGLNQRVAPVRSNLPYGFNKGQVTYFESQKKFGTEGTEALRRYFGDLLAKEAERGRSSFKLYQSKDHPHPVGAEFRKYMHAKITHGLIPDDIILDIGTSPARLAGQTDNNGQPLYERVWSCGPILSARDVVRQTLHKKSVSKLQDAGHHCLHSIVPGKIAQIDPDDPNWGPCGVCQGKFDAYTLIDSAYYENALEGAFWLGAKNEVPVYWVINDYHRAAREHGSTGRCCDNESKYEITYAPGQNASVKVTVNGNFTPYVHDVRATANDYWQYVYTDLVGNNLVVLNEVIDTFYNKDVPYIMVRSVPMFAEKLEPFGENTGIANVPILPLWVIEPSRSEADLTREVEQYMQYILDHCTQPDKILNPTQMASWGTMKAEVQPLLDATAASNHRTVSSVYNSTDLLDDVDDSMVITTLPQRLEQPLGDYPTDFTRDIDIEEFYNKRPEQPFDKMINFKARSVEFRKNSLWWAFIMRNWKSQTENFFLTVESGRTWVTLSSYQPRTCTFGCKVSHKDHCYKAPLDAVIEAYKKIGCKSQTSSIRFAISEYIKADDKEEICKIIGTRCFDVQEAFIIALAIKGQEVLRLENAMTTVPTLAAYSETTTKKGK